MCGLVRYTSFGTTKDKTLPEKDKDVTFETGDPRLQPQPHCLLAGPSWATVEGWLSSSL